MARSFTPSFFIARFSVRVLGKIGSTLRRTSIFAKKYGTLVRYAFFVMVRVRCAFFATVRVRYVGTMFELKIPDFLHIAPAFCMQRQKTAEADAKCVN